jgi:hypothetical protein
MQFRLTGNRFEKKRAPNNAAGSQLIWCGWEAVDTPLKHDANGACTHGSCASLTMCFPPLLLLLLPSKWCGRPKREMPRFDFKMLMGRGKGRKMCSWRSRRSTWVSCALVYWQFDAVGRAEKKKKKTKHTNTHPPTNTKGRNVSCCVIILGAIFELPPQERRTRVSCILFHRYCNQYNRTNIYNIESMAIQ